MVLFIMEYFQSTISLILSPVEENNSIKNVCKQHC